MCTAESPSFVESPERVLTLAEGQSAMFTCNVDGAPKPTLIWQKGETLTDVNELHDRRISVLPNGNLKIEVFGLLAYHRCKLLIRVVKSSSSSSIDVKYRQIINKIR